jgi:hypothetical protein
MTIKPTKHLIDYLGIKKNHFMLKYEFSVVALEKQYKEQQKEANSSKNQLSIEVLEKQYEEQQKESNSSKNQLSIGTLLETSPLVFSAPPPLNPTESTNPTSTQLNPNPTKSTSLPQITNV